MRDLHPWIRTLSLAGFALAALIAAIRPAQAVPVAPTGYAQCMHVKLIANTNKVIATQVTLGKFIEGEAPRQPLQMNGWAPVLYTPWGLLVCR